MACKAVFQSESAFSAYGRIDSSTYVVNDTVLLLKVCGIVFVLDINRVTNELPEAVRWSWATWRITNELLELVRLSFAIVRTTSELLDDVRLSLFNVRTTIELPEAVLRTSSANERTINDVWSATRLVVCVCVNLGTTTWTFLFETFSGISPLWALK